MKFIPYTKHSPVTDADVQAVVEALRSDRLTQGPIVPAFERALAEYLDVDPELVVACSSGTAALTLAYASLGVGPGWTVYVPAVTFAATASAALHLGARVVLVDVDPVTGLADSRHLCAVGMTGNSYYQDLAVSVHLRGEPADMDDLRQMFGEGRVVEDACHALGASGTGWGAAAAYSFHPAKHVATGEGGAVSFRRLAAAEIARELRDHGRAGATVAAPGYNFRLPDINAALGLSQLQRADDMLDRRHMLASQYDTRLGTVQPVPRSPHSALHLYCVRVPPGQVESLQAHLASRGIGSQRHYKPLHQHPAFKACQVGPLPGAEAYYQTTLSIPLFPSMADEEQERVIEACNEWRSK